MGNFRSPEKSKNATVGVMLVLRLIGLFFEVFI
jgi:hypothetical protein